VPWIWLPRGARWSRSRRRWGSVRPCFISGGRDKWRSRELVDTGVNPGRASEDAEDLAKANKRIRELEEEVKILRKAAAAVEEVVPPKARFALVVELAAEGVGVERACLCLGVSRSGYYEWRDRPPSARAIRHAWLTDLITTVHAASNGVYGRLRVRAELVHGHGITVGHRTVDLLMGRAGIHGLPKRGHVRKAGFPLTTDDLVNRCFARSGPNQLWVTDITEHPTREGKIYCCVVLEAWSRRVVG
jgi:putative transposase